MIDKRGGAALTGVLLLTLVGLGAWGLWQMSQSGEDPVSAWSLTPPLTRQDLRLTVIQKGELRAVSPHLIKNRVEGRTAILSILPEGTKLTPDDVAAKRVLIQLDTSTIEQNIAKQKIDVRSALEAVTNAQSNLRIQAHQHASEVRKAELTLRFARLDLARYVGEHVGEALEREHLDRVAAAREALAGADDAEGAPASEPMDETSIRDLLSQEALDGEAVQRLRDLSSDIDLAEEELRRAQDKVNHSKKLETKGFISREELDADLLALRRKQVEQERTKTAKQQFTRYDFPKEVQRLLSDVIEAHDALRRSRDKAAAARRKNKAEVASREAQHALKAQRLAHLERQKQLCTIHADVPGTVVYGSTGKEGRWRDDERIQEGTMVRERQTLLQIPDASEIAAIVKIHESLIRQVREGQPAAITLKSQGGLRLKGKVTRVSKMASSVDRWLNRELKVFETEVGFDASHPALKAGTTCTVEIVTGDLTQALFVPAQALVGRRKAYAVYVVDAAGRAVRKPVTVGASNDTHVEIQDGLQVGERVILNPPLGDAPEAASAPKRSSKT